MATRVPAQPLWCLSPLAATAVRWPRLLDRVPVSSGPSARPRLQSRGSQGLAASPDDAAKGPQRRERQARRHDGGRRHEIHASRQTVARASKSRTGEPRGKRSPSIQRLGSTVSSTWLQSGCCNRGVGTPRVKDRLFTILPRSRRPDPSRDDRGDPEQCSQGSRTDALPTAHRTISQSISSLPVQHSINFLLCHENKRPGRNAARLQCSRPAKGPLRCSG